MVGCTPRASHAPRAGQLAASPGPALPATAVPRPVTCVGAFRMRQAFGWAGPWWLICDFGFKLSPQVKAQPTPGSCRRRGAAHSAG